MKPANKTGFRLITLITLLSLITFVPLGAQQTVQRAFASPDQAATALFDALKNDDTTTLTAILGPEANTILASGDPVANRNERDRVVAKYAEMRRFVMEPDGAATLYIGAENWPFPIPLTQKGGQWTFNTAKGKTEILYRRIGRNERLTTETLRELTDAQKEYAARALWTTNRAEYATKFMSDEGAKNGLYWKAAEGQPQSPIGPLVAEATREGYKAGEAGATPFHGYVYRMLDRQGRSAPGGAMNYMVNGKMMRGFAFLAYPAKYRESGVMTFIAGQDGTVYQKDLGPDTARIARSMTTFNPDRSWKPVE